MALRPFLLACIVAAGVVLTACTTTQPVETPAVSSVTIDQADQAIEVGASVPLSATVETVGGASVEVTWSSSDERVASVSGAGVVTALAVGEAIVTATSAFDERQGDSVTITVVPPFDAALEIVPASRTLAPFGTFEVVAYRAGLPAPEVAWSASRGRVVEADGVTTFVAPGTPGAVTVTATVGPLHASAVFTVAAAVEHEVGIVDGAGAVSLPGGEEVSFSAGSLRAPTEVSLSSLDGPVADHGAGVRPLSRPVRVDVAKESIDPDGPGFTVWVPAGVSASAGDALVTLAEVRVALADGSVQVFLETYSTTVLEPDRVTLPGHVLMDLDRLVGLPDVVSVVVQPVALEAVDGTSVSRQAIDYVTGFFQVDLATARFDEASEVCGDRSERMPSWIVPASGTAVAGNRQPVVLVHGWQVFSNFGADVLDSIETLTALAKAANPIRWITARRDSTPTRNPGYCDWVPLIQHLADAGFAESIDLYTFAYDSTRHVGDVADELRGALEARFGDTQAVVVGHSMGGLVIDAAQYRGLQPLSVLTLGAPYLGSSVLYCGLSNPFSRRCVSAYVNPAVSLVSLPVLGLKTLLVYKLTSYQGTRDLTWEENFWSKNLFLIDLHKEETRDMRAFTAFYGDVRDDDAGRDNAYRMLQRAFFGPVTRSASDGIVPTTSATLDYDDGNGPRVGDVRMFFGLDHTQISGGADRATPPNCRMTQPTVDRDRACVAMKAIGEYLAAFAPVRHELSATPAGVMGSARTGASYVGSFELANTGAGSIEITGIEPSADWVHVSPSSVPVLAAGGVLDVEVVLHASGLEAGSYDADVVVSWEATDWSVAGSATVQIEFEVVVAGDARITAFALDLATPARVDSGRIVYGSVTVQVDAPDGVLVWIQPAAAGRLPSHAAGFDATFAYQASDVESGPVVRVDRYFAVTVGAKDLLVDGVRVLVVTAEEREVLLDELLPTSIDYRSVASMAVPTLSPASGVVPQGSDVDVQFEFSLDRERSAWLAVNPWSSTYAAGDWYEHVMATANVFDPVSWGTYEGAFTVLDTVAGEPDVDFLFVAIWDPDVPTSESWSVFSARWPVSFRFVAPSPGAAVRSAASAQRRVVDDVCAIGFEPEASRRCAGVEDPLR